MTSSEAGRGPAILTLGFATTVAMWAAAYVGRLPAVLAPEPVLLGAFLVCLLAGGLAAGRLTGRGIAGGALVGLTSGVLNLLVLGSLVSGNRPDEVMPSAAIWLPGSIVLSAGIGALGAALARRRSGREVDWVATFVKVAVGATLLLLAVGGLVTSARAGLAVVDWPNTYGYNMFLYPLSRMTGGIYYEHAHRLFGALVGLTTLVMAVVLQRHDPRAWVRRLGWVALVMVCVQGILGGLRVTGRLTMSESPDAMAPSLPLAVVHGVFGQLFFSALVALAVVTSKAWRRRADEVAPGATAFDRRLGIALVGLLVVQLVLGALQRHTQHMLLMHVTLAAIVAPLAIALGARGWALNPPGSTLRRWGRAIVFVAAIQVALGVGALIATVVYGANAVPHALDLLVATAHQWCGAILLGTAVATTLWAHHGEARETVRVGEAHARAV